MSVVVDNTPGRHNFKLIYADICWHFLTYEIYGQRNWTYRNLKPWEGTQTICQDLDKTNRYDLSMWTRTVWLAHTCIMSKPSLIINTKILCLRKSLIIEINLCNFVLLPTQWLVSVFLWRHLVLKTIDRHADRWTEREREIGWTEKEIF